MGIIIQAHSNSAPSLSRGVLHHLISFGGRQTFAQREKSGSAITHIIIALLSFRGTDDFSESNAVADLFHPILQAGQNITPPVPAGRGHVKREWGFPHDTTGRMFGQRQTANFIYIARRPTKLAQTTHSFERPVNVVVHEGFPGDDHEIEREKFRYIFIKFQKDFSSITPFHPCIVLRKTDTVNLSDFRHTVEIALTFLVAQASSQPSHLPKYVLPKSNLIPA